MKKRLVRFVRVSPAMVVAMAALFVALTGTAVATTSALITGNQIKNSSITGADIKNKSLRPIDFRGSVRGPRGLQGLPGAAGGKGDKGDKGDTGPPGPDLERYQASRDSTLGGTSIDVSTPRELNSVSITAPSSGSLLVTGQTFVNSTGVSGTYFLSPKLDGSFITPTNWAAAEQGTGLFMMDYEVSVAVSAGPHTVTQELNGPGGGTTFYNGNHLNVLFVPQGGVVPIPIAAANSSAALGD